MQAGSVHTVRLYGRFGTWPDSLNREKEKETPEPEPEPVVGRKRSVPHAMPPTRKNAPKTEHDAFKEHTTGKYVMGEVPKGLIRNARAVPKARPDILPMVRIANGRILTLAPSPYHRELQYGFVADTLQAAMVDSPETQPVAVVPTHVEQHGDTLHFGGYLRIHGLLAQIEVENRVNILFAPAFETLSKKDALTVAQHAARPIAGDKENMDTNEMARAYECIASLDSDFALRGDEWNNLNMLGTGHVCVSELERVLLGPRI
jgi:hypothetical protein